MNDTTKRENFFLRRILLFVIELSTFCLFLNFSDSSCHRISKRLGIQWKLSNDNYLTFLPKRDNFIQETPSGGAFHVSLLFLWKRDRLKEFCGVLRIVVVRAGNFLGCQTLLCRMGGCRAQEYVFLSDAMPKKFYFVVYWLKIKFMQPEFPFNSYRARHSWTNLQFYRLQSPGNRTTKSLRKFL